MQKQLSKKEFEEDYTLWIQSAAKDIAFSVSQLRPHEIKRIIARSEQYLKDPGSVYGTNGLETARKSVPSNIILLSTDAVVFSQSIFVRMASVFDYAVALNRRYYLGSWYSIITLNRKYLEEASENMLRFTIQHELLQKEIYEANIRNEARKFTPEEKKNISDETLKRAIEKSGITREEIGLEQALMLNISHNSPLIPKPFAETALYWYIESHLDELKFLGEPSMNEKEDALGKKLNADFKEWIDFSAGVYKLFLSEVKKELNYTDYGYA
ncbi:MAG: hypothetical protein KKI06_08435 [Euryarchaeota archaeon]|nr:hypothetical protein [Euryarchaeota archaeon]MBU4221612.1 hypothetical protein [Euryarchaeota archaeon]